MRVRPVQGLDNQLEAQGWQHEQGVELEYPLSA